MKLQVLIWAMLVKCKHFTVSKLCKQRPVTNIRCVHVLVCVELLSHV